MGQRPNSPAARDVAYHLHPYTNARKHEAEGPLIIESGDGVTVTDDSGKRYIEGLAGLWCTSLGFGNERLIRAAEQQMRRLAYYHSFAHKVPPPVIELSEKLIAMAPGNMGKVFYANSGSEANDTAIKLVWYYNNALGRPGKKKIISRQRAYHGVTIASASLTGLPYNHADFDLPIEGIRHTSCPHYWRGAQDGESEEDFATRMAADLEQLILDEGPETVAAFIGEPVMGAGGVITPPRTYWRKVQEVLKKYDVLLIADEVICGFGRTGDMFGCETYGIEPDMVTVAKALSSAYLPISAVMMRDEVYQAIADNTKKIGTLGHGFTYSGHPVSAAVALETLKIYDEMDIAARASELAPRLQNGLRRYADHPLVGEVRGIGMIAAVEPVANKATRAPFDPAGKVGAQLDQRCRAHGVILRNLGDTLAVCPPLVIEEEQVDTIVEVIGKALDETWEWVRQEGLAAA
ncbi:aspartate aminotransferase family protein [Ferruginivarius sediminum]|uniref:Aspartate aminotransferase family protein n=1 Tax=Ferruginivarius sediminum TaxID=2661937 RepID=A0A369TBA7_9PROT|nr:aspartate aminotransferase family protein [Ferruginivarius sediminum]RDD62560.1 aspartate aminotransferase family protein [Ferruginivarius sediminum]